MITETQIGVIDLYNGRTSSRSSPVKKQQCRYFSRGNGSILPASSPSVFFVINKMWSSFEKLLALSLSIPVVLVGGAESHVLRGGQGTQS